MNKREFKKLVKEYIEDRWGYLEYKSLYIDIDSNIFGYSAFCVIVVNSAIVYKVVIDSDVDKTRIANRELKIYNI